MLTSLVLIKVFWIISLSVTTILSYFKLFYVITNFSESCFNLDGTAEDAENLSLFLLLIILYSCVLVSYTDVETLKLLTPNFLAISFYNWSSLFYTLVFVMAIHCININSVVFCRLIDLKKVYYRLICVLLFI